MNLLGCPLWLFLWLWPLLFLVFCWLWLLIFLVHYFLLDFVKTKHVAPTSLQHWHFCTFIWWSNIFLFSFASLALQFDGNLTLSEPILFFLRTLILKKMGFLYMLFFQSWSRSNLLIPWNSLIICGVVKRLKADVVRSPLFRWKNSWLVRDNTDDIQILIALFRKGNVYSCRKTFVDFFQITFHLIFSVLRKDE